MSYKISICIPTYNGSDVLSETLDSLIKEIELYPVEIVINDDKSSDSTLEIAKSFAMKYPFISIYQNENNLKMDRNFTATALKAKGEYVWLCGQDDILQYGVVEKAINIIEKNSDINFIYFNYKFVDDDLETEVMSPRLEVEKDKYFESMKSYFDVLDHAPSFLPANLMKKEFWETTDYEQYYDTYYVQTGVWLENFHKGKVYVVANPEHVLCRVPQDSWKYNDGKMIFGTATGSLKAYKTAYKNKKISLDIYRRKEDEYIKKFLLNIIACKAKGLVFSDALYRDVEYIFANNKSRLFYVKFLSYMPVVVAGALYKIGRIVKKVAKKYA